MSNETEPLPTPSVPQAAPVVVDAPVDELPEPAPEVEPVQEELVATEATPAPAETKMEPRPAQNVWIDGLLSTKSDTPFELTIALPSDTDARTKDFLDRTPNIKLMDSEIGDRWAETVKGSLGMSAFQDTFIRTLENPEAEFHQTLELNGTRFGSHEARFKSKQNSEFSGELAVIRTISHLGLGSIFNVGLYNSGVWVSFKPPAEDDLVELHRQLTADKIQMGRSSYGLVYANSTSFTTGRLLQFAMEHVYRFSADNKEINPENALQHLSVLDINTILWGLACTMFPRGFAYSRACTSNPEKCQYVANETLNLRKLQWVDRRALTDKQKAQLANNRQATEMKLQDLKSYQADMTRLSSHRIVAREGQTDEIIFNLRAPSIQEYIETGHRWIDDMVDTVDASLGSNPSDAERNRQVDLRTRASIMRQYSHWVASIEFDGNQIKDRASVESVLNNISGDRDVRTTFLKGVTRYIETGSVSVIGIPTFDCPVCGTPNEGHLNYPHKSTVIPLDVIQLFFVLLTQKHRDLQNR